MSAITSPTAGKVSPAVGISRWTVPPMWRRRAAFILGGSPWLRDFNVDRLRGLGAVVAINNAYRIAPWADLLYWADADWFRRAWAEVAVQWGSGILATRSDPEHVPTRSWHIKLLRHDRTVGLSEDPGAVAGWCSGTNALNIAWHARADPIYLLGFDGRASGHWHEGYGSTAREDGYARYIRPAFDAMALGLRAKGARVFNCTPESAIKSIPYADIEDVMKERTRCR